MLKYIYIYRNYKYIYVYILKVVKKKKGKNSRDGYNPKFKRKEKKNFFFEIYFY